MVNSLTLVLIVVVWFTFGYFIYSKFLDKKLVQPKDKNKTPAQKKKGIDYKNYVIKMELAEINL